MKSVVELKIRLPLTIVQPENFGTSAGCSESPSMPLQTEEFTRTLVCS